MPNEHFLSNIMVRTTWRWWCLHYTRPTSFAGFL